MGKTSYQNIETEIKKNLSVVTSFEREEKMNHTINYIDQLFGLEHWMRNILR